MKETKTGYLGPVGTYSYLAAQQLCPDTGLVPYPTFAAMFAALGCGDVSTIVLPIENTLNGAVTQNLDLLYANRNAYAKAAVSLKLDHRLVLLRGVDGGAVTRIYSHPQALAQCSQFIAENYPLAKLVETASTVECFEKLKVPTDAGIVGAHCKREGFELSKECISDEPLNFTQFLKVENGEPSKDCGTDRIFFAFTCRHRVGELVRLLTVLRDGGINMTEIESRPIKGRTGEFRFFIEVEGDYSDGATRASLDRLAAESHSFKLLGCYKYTPPVTIA